MNETTDLVLRRLSHIALLLLTALLLNVPLAAQSQAQRGDTTFMSIAAAPADTMDAHTLHSGASYDGAEIEESTASFDSTQSESFPRLTQGEYLDADLPRFTMNGDLPYRETHISTGTLSAFGGALLGLAATMTLYQQAWYPDSTVGPFNFQIDWGYSKQFDKAGHVFAGWMSSYCSHEAFIASGMSKEDAALYGALGGLLFQTIIETQDGFHTNYGFDWTDQGANIIGCAYFYAQRTIPELQNFNLKWSVGESGRDPARDAAQIRSRIIVDDYDRQNVWLSAKVHNLLPEHLRSYWPRWLQLAIGYGAKDVELTGYEAYRTVHLSLDYDLVALLPDMGSFGNWLVQGLNNFHLPAPALQIYPDVQFKILFPIGL
jgi:hypothetical protein